MRTDPRQALGAAGVTASACSAPAPVGSTSASPPSRCPAALAGGLMLAFTAAVACLRLAGLAWARWLRRATRRWPTPWLRRAVVRSGNLPWLVSHGFPWLYSGYANWTVRSPAAPLGGMGWCRSPGPERGMRATCRSCAGSGRLAAGVLAVGALGIGLASGTLDRAVRRALKVVAIRQCGPSMKWDRPRSIIIWRCTAT